MISLKKILLELEANQKPLPVPDQPSTGNSPLGLGTEQNQSIELPKYNLIVSIMEAEKKFNFSPLDTTKPAPQARTLINQLKQKFKVSLVRQQAGNTFEVTLDPREEIGLVQDFLQQNAAI